MQSIKKVSPLYMFIDTSVSTRKTLTTYGLTLIDDKHKKVRN
jgi:hypothetical protein